MVESCSRRIDCCSCGVSVRCCESLSCRVCFIEMRREGLARRIVVQTGHIGNGVYRGMRFPLQPEIFAEINASYVFIINDLVRFAEGEHQSVVDDVGVVGMWGQGSSMETRDAASSSRSSCNSSTARMFSSTVSLRNTEASWGRYDNPMRAWRCIAKWLSSLPSRWIAPSSTATNPTIM